MLTLELLSKQNNKYKVRYNGEVMIVSESKITELISKTLPKFRNCKLVNGKIYRKANKSTGDKILVITKLTSKYTKDRKVIFSVDAVAGKLLWDKDFLTKNQDVILAIDNSVIIDYKTLTIKSPYGLTSIDNISTGAKAALIARYLVQKKLTDHYILNIDECGDNALSIILNELSNTGCMVYTTRLSIALLELAEKLGGLVINNKKYSLEEVYDVF